MDLNLANADTKQIYNLLIGLVAPRPMFVESGTEDDLFSATVAAVGCERLRRVYRSLGASEDRIVHEISEGGHQWYGVGAFDFLERWLGGAPGGTGRLAGNRLAGDQ